MWLLLEYPITNVMIHEE